MSDLVGNPADTFSRDAAHMVVNLPGGLNPGGGGPIGIKPGGALPRSPVGGPSRGGPPGPMGGGGPGGGPCNIPGGIPICWFMICCNCS